MTITDIKPSETKHRFISMDLIERVKRNRTKAYVTHGGDGEKLTPWDDLTPKERFAAIQAFA